MGKVKTYDPKLVTVIFGGVPISGFADGTFVTVTPAAERFTKTVGADGEVSRAKSNDKTAEVALTLIQTSPSNDYLSSILAIDNASNLGKLPLQIVDLSGTTVQSWSEAWLKQPPDLEFSKETGERAWMFDTGQPDVENFGGNL